MTKRWRSRVVCLWSVSSAAHLSGAKTSVFLLRVRTLFALARCTETICHYVSKCKTCAPCIVMCHLSKLPGPLPLCSSCNVTRPFTYAHAHRCQNYQSIQGCSTELISSLLPANCVFGRKGIPSENKKDLLFFQYVLKGMTQRRERFFFWEIQQLWRKYLVFFLVCLNAYLLLQVSLIIFLLLRCFACSNGSVYPPGLHSENEPGTNLQRIQS